MPCSAASWPRGRMSGRQRSFSEAFSDAMQRIMTLALNWCGRQYRLAANVLVAALTQWGPNGSRSEVTKKSRASFAPGVDQYQLEIAQEPIERDVRFLRHAIYAYNRAKAG